MIFMTLSQNVAVWLIKKVHSVVLQSGNCTGYPSEWRPHTLISGCYGILTLKLLAAKTRFKHRPIKHWKTTALTKDGKKLKALAGATRDFISGTNWRYSRTNAKI